MNDRELLEAAAKAAGYVHYHPGDGFYQTWNPLTDDGDALRLAVKLEIHIQTDGRYCWASTFSVNATEESDVDTYAATRRAIVRCAAQIGRQDLAHQIPDATDKIA